MADAPTEYAWLEWKYRPLREGLHDSGYRYIQVAGVVIEMLPASDGELVQQQTRYSLHQWADHIIVEGSVNMDVEPNGTMRIMPWLGEVIVEKYETDFRGSDAWFEVKNKENNT